MVMMLQLRSVLRLLSLLMALLLVATACRAERPVLTATAIPPVTEPRKPPNREVIEIRNPAVDTSVDVATVAIATTGEVDVYAEPNPGADVEPLRTMANPTVSGGPLVLLVDQTVGDWHEVLLPVRPNGTTGWIHNDDVDTGTHNYRIDVNLSDFELSVHQGGALIFQATVAVARENAPTPGGRYFITELLQPLEPNSIYGDFAYGLSGFSETFETFNGGPGQLGIHGTNDPDAIGTQASAGCVRLANGDIAHLITFLPLGTPVTITA